MKFLYYCDATRRSTARSGIHRVIVEAARALRQIADVDFVVWDDLQGQLRYANRHDLQAVFLDEEFVSTSPVNAFAERVSYRFGDTIEDPGETWLIFPEIAYHTVNGNERYSRILTQCREYGIPVASILYDIIPIAERGYEEIKPDHVRYIKYLCRSDAILPISRYSGEDLLDWLKGEGALTAETETYLRGAIHPIRLGQVREGQVPLEPAASPDAGARLNIISVGTIEPRKQQTRFLKIFNRLAEKHPHLREAKIDLFGSLHPACAQDLAAAIRTNPNIVHHGYTTDAEIARVYANADFSFFISKSEGFGLPIVESLWYGIPCLCANFGAMAEVAEGGGCLMIDVRSDDDIATGIMRLVDDAEMRQGLRREAAEREAVTWTDYARNLQSCLQAISEQKNQTLQAAVDALVDHGEATIAGGSVRLNLDRALPAGGASPRTSGLADGGVRGILLDTVPEASEIGALSEYDTCAVGSQTAKEALYRVWGLESPSGMLPPRVLVENLEDGEDRGRRLAQVLVKRADHVARLKQVAALEKTCSLIGRKISHLEAKSSPLLSIVISTYNRAPFVDLNVEWLLEISEEFGKDVQIVVVDNASTDDTMARLQRFVGKQGLHIRKNNANTGMLGNLNVCSQLELARHVWITGDDDFIQPDVLRRVVETLRADPELPLAMVNFSVYYRNHVREGDSPTTYARESTPLAPKSAPDGRYPIRVIAEQHDNLFTAIYPIIWRSDILAACFNYPFTGTPFADLVECVPTTKLLLETYAFVEAAWFSATGTVGNAHNSWSHHRPRWHAVIMPEVFELARDGGVNDRILKKWSKIHADLYEEAIEIASRANMRIHLDPEELERPLRLFGQKPRVPDGIRRYRDRNDLLVWWGANGQ